MPIELSKYQSAVIQHIKESPCSLAVNAYAGSGKTTTIGFILEAVPKTLSVLVVAFNKAIAEELVKRYGHLGCTIKTLNAFGHGIVTKTGWCKVDADKTFGEFFNAVGGTWKPKWAFPNDEIKGLYYSIRHILKRCIGLLQANCIQKPSEIDILNTLHDYDLVPANCKVELDVITRYVQQVYAMHLANSKRIDFDNQLSFPIFKNLPVPQYDLILVDEAQDLNKIQLELIAKALSPNGRLIAVGDKRQAIYGFRGADPKSFGTIITRFTCNELPLSICYRCSKAVIREAQKLVPEIEGSDTAPEGSVKEIPDTSLDNLLKSGDAILCRTNAPIIRKCFALIKKGVKAVIRGRDIGASIQDFIDSFKANDVQDAIAKVTAWQEQQLAKLAEANKDTESRIVQITDRAEVALVFLMQCQTLQEVTDKINILFSDDTTNPGILLSSIHKAKGLEWDNVYILRPDQLPHPAAKSEWAREQEANLKYVAITRAKVNLVYVNRTTKGEVEDKNT